MFDWRYNVHSICICYLIPLLISCFCILHTNPNKALLENCDHNNRNSTNFYCSGQLRSEVGFFHRSLLYGVQYLPSFCWHWRWCHEVADCMNVMTWQWSCVRTVRWQLWTFFYGPVYCSVWNSLIYMYDSWLVDCEIYLSGYLGTFLVVIGRGLCTNKWLHHILSCILFCLQICPNMYSIYLPCSQLKCFHPKGLRRQTASALHNYQGLQWRPTPKEYTPHATCQKLTNS